MNPNGTSREEILEELKLRFIHAWESGSGPDVESYARQNPEFADELIPFGVQFALAFTGPEPKEEECDDFDASEAMRHALNDRRSLSNDPEATQAESCDMVPTLGEHLKASGSRVDQLADAINLPTGFVYMLAQGAIDPPPRKLVDRVASYCGLGNVAALSMLNRPTQPIQSSYLLRSKSGESASRSKMTFGQALKKCKESGELTPEQEADWAEEMNS